jgi:lipopolysaccharide export system permease protein
MAFNDTQTDLYLTLYDGEMHERETKDPAMDQHTFYEKQVFRVSGVTNELKRGAAIDWRSDREMNIEMMQKEIIERHVRVLQIEDSLSLAIQDLTPIRDRPEERTRSDSDPDLIIKPPRSNRGRPNVGRIAQQVAREDSEDVVGSTEESIRQRYRPSTRAEWPPKGSPVAFAARMKNELTRIASRAEIHRREMNKYAVEIHKKIAIPIAAVVFVLIGAPIGARFPRGGIGMVIGVSLSIFCVYYVGLIGGENLADRNFITPFWAMWAPNVIFAVIGGIAFYLVTKSGTRKLGVRIGVGRRAVPRVQKDKAQADLEKSTA